MKKSVLSTGIAVVLLSVNAFGFAVPETLRYELSVGGVAIGDLSMGAKDAGEKVKLVSTMSKLGIHPAISGLKKSMTSRLMNS